MQHALEGHGCLSRQCRNCKGRAGKPATQVLLTVAECPRGCSLPEGGDGEWDAPQPLLSSESTEWDAIPNLDDFFRRIYKCAASALHCLSSTLMVL